MPKTPPPPPQPDPDFEPQPLIGGHDPWRELQPEHDEVVRRQMELYANDRLEVAILITQCLGQGRGVELIELLTKMVKAMPRSTYEEVLRRDAKMDLIDWLSQEMDYAKNV